MTATSLDLSAIKTDALSAASTFRTLIGLGTLATQSPTGTANSTTYLRGDFTWQTISAGASWGSITGTLSSQTDLQSALDAKASLSGATFTGRITTPSILLSGNFSSTAWTTSGVGLSHTARTLTDTSSTGTVATAYTNVLGGNTIAASNATTFTDYASLFIGSPTAGSNVTITNPFSLITQGAARFGGAVGVSAGTLNGTVLDVSQTWGGTGTYTGIRYNVTDSGPSNAASLLMDLQVGGTSRLALDKNGWLRLRDSLYSLGVITNLTNVPYMVMSTAQLYLNTSISLSNNNPVNGPDVVLTRDAANTLAIRNGTSAQTFRLYRTADGSPGSNYERLALSSTTYSSAVYQTILCESGGTGAANINLVLSPKGTGAILAQVPDGTATGGNARGANAVDLQTARWAATHVASNTYSVVSGGYANTASGQWSGVSFGRDNTASGLYSTVAGGRSCTSSGDNASVVGGWSNNASGSYAFMGGGHDNVASAFMAIVVGGKQALADRPYQQAYAAAQFSTRGDAQEVKFILKKKTIDSTPTTLLTDDTYRLTIPSGKVFAFVAKISGIKSDGSAVAFYTRKGAIKNVGGTTSLVGSIETIGTDTEDNASTDVAITADDTNDALQINVTGIAAQTWRWVAVVEGVEIGYGT